MKISRTGIILNTEKYDECVAFYKTVFDLTVIFEKQEGNFRLTCFDFQKAYLMIETGGIACSEGKTMEQNSTKIRINVRDINEALDELKTKGIKAEITNNDWGKTINLFDPDGNRVGIRDERTFSEQLFG